MAAIVLSEDAMHRVGNDDAWTNDLFRITRKEAVRVPVRRIVFTLTLTLTFTRLAFSRTKRRRELHNRVWRVSVAVRLWVPSTVAATTTTAHHDNSKSGSMRPARS